MQKLCRAYGSPLSMGKQLRWILQLEALPPVFDIRILGLCSCDDFDRNTIIWVLQCKLLHVYRQLPDFHRRVLHLFGATFCHLRMCNVLRLDIVHN